MKYAIALPALLMLSLAAWAAGPKTRFIDHSSESLIGEAEAVAVMAAIVPAKVWKLYPAAKFAFSSQVEGGMKGSTCVIAARVMLLPVTATKAALFQPQKTATAFDALANSSLEACKTLARDKLKEATGAVVSDLVKT